MNSLLDVLCDSEREVFSRIEACPEHREAIDRAIAIEKEITKANPEMYETMYDLDAAYLEAQAALEKNGYRIGLLDGFKLAMEMMGWGGKINESLLG